MIYNIPLTAAICHPSASAALPLEKETVSVFYRIKLSTMRRLWLSFFIQNHLKFLAWTTKFRLLLSFFLSLPFHYTIRLFLFELEIYLCCNNKTVIIVEFFRMYILNDKEINRASLTICISIDGKVSAPSIFFFLLINRINSIIYTHTHTKSMMMTLIFIIKLMYMTYWTLNYSFTQRNDEFSYPSILIYIYAFVGTLNFLYSDNDY